MKHPLFKVRKDNLESKRSEFQKTQQQELAKKTLSKVTHACKLLMQEKPRQRET